MTLSVQLRSRYSDLRALQEVVASRSWKEASWGGEVEARKRDRGVPCSFEHPCSESGPVEPHRAGMVAALDFIPAFQPGGGTLAKAHSQALVENS